MALIAVDFMAYLKASKLKPPKGGLMAQWALRVRQWGVYVHYKCESAVKELSDAELTELDRQNGFEGEWWRNA